MDEFDKRHERGAPTPLPLFLGILFLVSTANMADRQLVAVLAEPIKREFALSDTALSLVSGTAFALVYPPLGLPLAWLADRFSRRNILAASLAVWSGATMACGLVPGFWGLVASRAAVAAGEAGYAPSAHALVADYVSEKRRATAFSILVLGISAGSLFASVVGGAIADNFGWRAAFLALGAPGLLVAMAVRIAIQEPARARRSGRSGSPLAPLKRLLLNPTFAFCVLGSGLHLMVAYGKAAWTTAYFVRTHGMSLTEVGLMVGTIAAAGAAAGGFLGGLVGDRLSAIDRRWLAWWPAVTVAAAGCIGVPAFVTGNLVLAIAGTSLAVFLNALYQPSTYALVQRIADPDDRASAAALMIFVQNLIGLGLGPLTVGILSDGLQPAMGVRALGMALAILFSLNFLSAGAYYLSGLYFKRASGP